MNLKLTSRFTQKGQTLIIILVSIVLLSAVVVGILVSALYNGKISANSASQAKADLAAQAAVSQIVSNLQQEIIDGSGQPTTPNFYIPNGLLATGYSANITPYINAYPTAYPAPIVPNGLENLIKASLYDIPLYPFGVAPNGAVYNAAGVKQASAALTTSNSLNGHNVSLARWQEPMLTSTHSTTAFPTPNWILVAADGTNPTGAFAAAVSGISGTNPVTQRFAYTIYDEGGILDLNVAGYPTAPTLQGSTHSSFKNALAYADLSRPPISLSTADINALVGWRNYSTTQTSGTLGNYTTGQPATISPSNFSYFDYFISFNSSGFLEAGNIAQFLDPTQLAAPFASDNFFSSRQQMIQFLTQLDPKLNADTIQYFGTFSRGISQPSYIPPPGRPKTSPLNAGVTDPVANAPSTNTAFGNDDNINPRFLDVILPGGTTLVRNDGSAGIAGEPLVKKRFALNRLAWLTYKGPISDGKNAGTIAIRAKDVNSTDPDLTNMAQLLHDQYGLSYAFLQQGTAANIYKYFGLSWGMDDRTNSAYTIGDNNQKWLYYHPNNGTVPFIQYTTIPYGANKSIFLLNDLANGTNGAPLREPDFFELLKASISCGSKALAAYPQGVPPPLPPYPPAYYQSMIDSSLDNAIIQIGANIMDQYDLDGYPTHILFNDGISQLANEFNGSENIPYIYRVRKARVQAQAPVISAAPAGEATFKSGGDSTFGAGTITNFGANVLLEFPEVWNPYAYYPRSPYFAHRCALDSAGKELTDSTGIPLYPQTFRIVADSTDPWDVYGLTGPVPNLLFYDQVNKYSTAAGSAATIEQATSSTAKNSNYVASNGYGSVAAANVTSFTPSAFGGTSPFNKATDFRYPYFPLTSESTAMQFNYFPGDDANFREPTILCMQGIPAGSHLQVSGTQNILNKKIAIFPSTIPSSGPNPQVLINSNNALTTSQKNNYGGANNNIIGIYLNTLPCAWYLNTFAVTKQQSPTSPPVQPAGVGLVGPVAPVLTQQSYGFGSSGSGIKNPDRYADATYRLQYQEINSNGIAAWHTYDEKYILDNKIISGHTTDSLTSPYAQVQDDIYNDFPYTVVYDARTNRWGSLLCNSSTRGINRNQLTANNDTLYGGFTPPNNLPTFTGGVSSMSPLTAPATCWINTALAALPSQCPDFAQGYKMNSPSGAPNNTNNFVNIANLYLNVFQSNLYNGAGTYYYDPDGVVRNAMGSRASANNSFGLPMAMTTGNLETIALNQAQSRPVILNRPFTSVAELGTVFSGTAWKNLDFSNANSGDAPLLDVFCINDTDNPHALVDGVLNLNTRQIPVLRAFISGAYKDTEDYQKTILNPGETAAIANALFTRTNINEHPLTNISDLVGRYISGVSPAAVYDGFSSDLDTVYTAGTPTFILQRMREAPIRALSAVGNTRVWNLMIDVVAQSGRYPATAVTADNFVVEGEQRYWVHIAIDRYTGKILDKSVELVKQ